MKKKKIKLIDDDMPQSKIIDPVLDKEKKKEKGKPGRPTIFTPELRAKLIKLFEENFFIAIVAASADIYRQQIEEWEREHKDFNANVTHARDKWIKQQMILLDQYAIDKKTKDWRALKYKLSIADVEYNDKKYLREELGKRESSQITIIINRKDLQTSKEEAYKIIGERSHKEETISLITFKEEKKEKKGEKKKSGEAKNE
jgi:hypothetical protein